MAQVAATLSVLSLFLRLNAVSAGVTALGNDPALVERLTACALSAPCPPPPLRNALPMAGTPCIKPCCCLSLCAHVEVAQHAARETAWMRQCVVGLQSLTGWTQSIWW